MKPRVVAGSMVAILLLSCGQGVTGDTEPVETGAPDATLDQSLEEDTSTVLEGIDEEEPPDDDVPPECDYLEDMSQQWQYFANQEGVVPPLLPSQADQWLLALGRQDVPQSVIMEHTEIEQSLRRIVKVFEDHPGSLSLNLSESHHQLSRVRRTLSTLENEHDCDVHFAEMATLPD